MEKNRSSKIVAVVALVVAVFGLTLGFAAFSNTLVISSAATVKPDSSAFSVLFSSSPDEVATLAVQGVATGEGASAEPATINGTTISGLVANFTAPEQTVTYTFYVHNVGDYEAFLKTITFENVTDQENTKVCTKTADSTATENLVQAACEDISIAIQVGGQQATGSVGGIKEHNLIAKTGKETVVVTISYAADGDRADGDFNVAFGDIKLGYSSSDEEQA